MVVQSIIRIIAVLSGLLIFVTDYGFDLWAKSVPHNVYIGLALIAAGTEIKDIREILLSVLRGKTGGGK